MTRLRRYIVKTIFSETSCNGCGRPICIGDHVWEDTEECWHFHYCSLVCFSDARADAKKRGKNEDTEER